MNDYRSATIWMHWLPKVAAIITASIEQVSVSTLLYSILILQSSR
jgi:hypothetical protein